MTEPAAANWALQHGASLGVALGCGLLVGLERERRKGQGPHREPAGIRTFTVTALAGALAQASGVDGLVLAGAVLVGALVGLAYWRNRSDDPGLTTEIALFAIYLIGVLAVGSPALAAACGVALAALLAAREHLHRFSTVLLSEQELHDGLLLAALLLIALPVVPSGPLAWAAGIDLQRVVGLLAMILGVQAAGHVALRALGPRGGLPLAGFLSGFVSSTATVATLGRRAAAEPQLGVALAAAAGLSGSATWVLAGLIVAAVTPGAAAALWPMMLAGALAPPAILLLALRGQPGSGQVLPAGSRPLRPREALVVAALLAGVSAVVAALQTAFGTLAVYASAALAACADLHAAVAALASLHAQQRLADPVLVAGILLAGVVNTGVRVGVAALAGGWTYAGRVAGPLVASVAAAAGVAWATGRLG